MSVKSHVKKKKGPLNCNTPGGASQALTPREDLAALTTKYYSVLQKTMMTVTCCFAFAKRCFKSTLISPPPPSIHSQPVFSLLH